METIYKLREILTTATGLNATDIKSITLSPIENRMCSDVGKLLLLELDQREIALQGLSKLPHIIEWVDNLGENYKAIASQVLIASEIEKF